MSSRANISVAKFPPLLLTRFPQISARSLTREAFESGKKAKAYRTILTHFSQRYPKIPIVDDTFTTSTCIAFDLMTFHLGNIERLPRVVPEAAVRY